MDQVNSEQQELFEQQDTKLLQLKHNQQEIQQNIFSVRKFLSQPNPLMDKIQFVPYQVNSYYPYSLIRLPSALSDFKGTQIDKNNMNSIIQASFQHQKIKKQVREAILNKQNFQQSQDQLLLKIQQYYQNKSCLYQRYQPQSLKLDDNIKKMKCFATYILDIAQILQKQSKKCKKKDNRLISAPRGSNYTSRQTRQTKLSTIYSPIQYPISSSKSQCKIEFNSNFQSGNLFKAYQVGYNQFDLIVQNDINTKGNNQWFYFSVKNVLKNHILKFNLVNMSKKTSLFNLGMKPCVFSMTRNQKRNIGWVRQGQKVIYKKSNKIKKQSSPYYQLSFQYKFIYQGDVVYFAHSPPYTYSHLSTYLLKIFSNKKYSKLIKLKELGQTLGGNIVDLIQITNLEVRKQNKKVIWIIARQHSGQITSGFMIQGIINFLLSELEQSKYLLNNFIFKIVPMINIDGVIHGNSRAELIGVDPNRKWISPHKYHNPIIYQIKSFIEKDKNCIQMVLDLHSHSKRLETFFYGNTLKENTAATRIFPLLVCKNDKRFSFKYCRFSGGNSLTARSTLFQSLKIPLVYTVQSSFYGFQNQNKTINPYTTKDYQEMGAALMNSLATYNFKKSCRSIYSFKHLTYTDFFKQQIEIQQINQDNTSIASDDTPNQDQFSEKQIDKLISKIKRKAKHKKAKVIKEKKMIEPINPQQKLQKIKINTSESYYKQYFSGRISQNKVQNIQYFVNQEKKKTIKSSTINAAVQVNIKQNMILKKKQSNNQIIFNKQNTSSSQKHIAHSLCVIGQKVQQISVFNNTVGIQVTQQKQIFMRRVDHSAISNRKSFNLKSKPNHLQRRPWNNLAYQQKIWEMILLQNFKFQEDIKQSLQNLYKLNKKGKLYQHFLQQYFNLNQLIERMLLRFLQKKIQSQAFQFSLAKCIQFRRIESFNPLKKKGQYFFSVQYQQQFHQIKNKKFSSKDCFLIDNYSIINDSFDKKSLLIQEMLSSNQENIYKLLQQLLITLESFSSKEDLLEQNILKVVQKYTNKIKKQIESQNQKQLAIEFILYYIETVKFWILSKIENQQKIEKCFQIINGFFCSQKGSIINNTFIQSLEMVDKFIQNKIQLQIQLQVRTSCLIPYMEKDKLNQYLSKIEELQLVKHFKQSQLILFMYDCSKLKPELSIELVAQIQASEYYQKITQLNKAFIKSEFARFVKKTMTCYNQRQFFPFLRQLRSELNMPSIKTMLRILKIFQIETEQCFSEVNKTTNKYIYNDIISVLISYKYASQNNQLKDFLQLYLTLNKIYPNGQTLYEQLTKFLYNFMEQKKTPSKEELQLCLIVFEKINLQIQPIYKYQKIDLSNKQFSIKTINLNNLLMKLLAKTNPQIIFANNTLEYYLNQNEQNLKFVANYLHELLKEKSVNILDNFQNENIILLKKILNVAKKTKYKIITQQKKLIQILLSFAQDLSKLLKKGQNFKQIQKKTYKSFEIVYDLLSILSTKEKQDYIQNNIQECLQKLCLEIMKFISLINKEQNTLINTNKKYYNYLLLIFYQCSCKFKQFDNFMVIVEPYLMELSQFINKKMIFSVKSSRNLQTIKMIKLIIKLRNRAVQKMSFNSQKYIEPIIFQYLYSCLSTLTIFNQKTNKYYLKNELSKDLLQIVQSFSSQKLFYKQINQKSDLSMLQISLFILIKKKLVKPESLPQILLNYMQIFGSLDNIGSDLQSIIESTKFNFQLLDQYPVQILIEFSPISKSIAQYLNHKNITSAQLIKLEDLNYSQIQQTFKHKKIYQIIFKNPKIKLNFQIPQPKTNDQQTHMFYICQKLFKKISEKYNYDFFLQQKKDNDISQQKSNERHIIKDQLNFSQEKAYIISKSLVSFTDFNQFKLQVHKLPQFSVTQIWKFFDNLKPEDEIEKLSITENFDIDIYRNLILGIFGFQQKIKDLANNFRHHGFVTFQANNLGLQIKAHGCILNLFRKSDPSKSLLVICAVEHNYKVLNICAYILERAGYDVVIVNQKVPKKQLKVFLEQRFPQTEEDDEQKMLKEGEVNEMQNSEMTIQTLQ